MPLVFDFKKGLTKAVIIDLEDNKEETKDSKELDNQLKNSTCFFNSIDFNSFHVFGSKTVNLNFYSKKYINAFHSKVLTPPPNFMCS